MWTLDLQYFKKTSHPFNIFTIFPPHLRQYLKQPSRETYNLLKSSGPANQKPKPSLSLRVSHLTGPQGLTMSLHMEAKHSLFFGGGGGGTLMLAGGP